MPHYVNPDNPNAGELFVTKTDPKTGITVDVPPDAEPTFKMPKEDPKTHEQSTFAHGKPPKPQTEEDVEKAKEADEAEKAAAADLKDAHDRGETSGKREDDTKPAKKTTKKTVDSKAPFLRAKKDDAVVNPVEKAGEKTESDYYSQRTVPTRGVLTTQTPTTTHVDTKSPVFEDKT